MMQKMKLGPSYHFKKKRKIKMIKIKKKCRGLGQTESVKKTGGGSAASKVKL